MPASAGSPGPASDLDVQWGKPAGAYAGRPPRLVVMLLPGGAWRAVKPGNLAAIEGAAPGLEREGYATAALAYRGGSQSLEDVEALYREVRRRYGDDVPVCVFGVSAGGNLGLLLAAREPGVSCVIDVAGPTDLPALDGPGGSEQGYGLAITGLGLDKLRAFSPALHADSIEAKLLLLFATNDPLVPPSQGRIMRRRKPDAHVMVLPGDDSPDGRILAHSNVEPAALARAQAAELALLASVARPAA